MKNVEFGKRLQIFRESLGPECTQTIFAKKIGPEYTQANVSSWEKGTIPYGDTLFLILTAFPQLNGAWLFSKDDNMIKNPPDSLSQHERERLQNLVDMWKQLYIEAKEGRDK
jgi:hypothetical protein